MSYPIVIRKNIQLLLTALIIVLAGHPSAYAQLTPISLEQRIDKSSVVFEGKVVKQTSFWDEGKRNIYTSNVVQIYKIFKGRLATGQVEIITRGGTVRNEMQVASHSLVLLPDETGIFTAIPNTVRFAKATSLIRLKTYADAQGFIRYDTKTGSAKDVFTIYKRIDKDVYPKIIQRTKVNYRVIAKPDFNIQ